MTTWINYVDNDKPMNNTISRHPNSKVDLDIVDCIYNKKYNVLRTIHTSMSATIHVHNYRTGISKEFIYNINKTHLFHKAHEMEVCWVYESSDGIYLLMFQNEYPLKYIKRVSTDLSYKDIPFNPADYI